MVRIPLAMCVPDMVNPVDVFAGENQKQLLVAKGARLTTRTRELLAKNNVRYLDFSLPHETGEQAPFTFSEEVESGLFELAQKTFIGFREDAHEDPYEIRKHAYDILAQGFQELQTLTRGERPMGDASPKRSKKSVLHLRTVGAISDYLYEHAKNVSLTSLVLGMNFFDNVEHLLAEIHKVSVAALFADIGMMKVPERILQKNQALTDEDWALVHAHPLESAKFAAQMFRQKNFLTPKIIEQHHERADGSGYPNQRGGEHIIPHAYLLAVADTYHSMISKRFHREPRHPVDAIVYINERAESLYTPAAARCLNFRVAPFPIGSVAVFNKKSYAQITGLTNVPTEKDKVRLLNQQQRQKVYNRPKAVRAFNPDRPHEKAKVANIEAHWDKLDAPLDTFDLLKIYGYVQEEGD